MMEHIHSLIELAKQNPMIAASAGLYVTGIVTYILRDIPRKIITAISSECVTTLEVLRPGRFDLKIKIDYLTTETFKEYLGLFFDSVVIPEGFAIRENFTPAELQDIVLNNINSLDEVIKQSRKLDSLS